MILNLSNISSEPLHLQISRQIKNRILNGDLKSGTELLPVRVLAKQQHVNKRIILKAYTELMKAGYLLPAGYEKFYVNQLTDKKLNELKEDNLLEDWSTSEGQRIQDELKAAKQIQKNLLPKELLDTSELNLAAYYCPAQEVGGDFYDFLTNGGDSFGLVIGDASGKGMPAAMLMLQIQAILKSDKNHERSVHQTMEILNDYLCKNIPAKHFATLFWGTYDYSNGSLVYINAGHNFPIIIHQNDETQFLKTTGPALGIIKNASFSVESVELQQGDTLVLYTDGVTEAMNLQKDTYGESRLQEILINNRTKKSEEIINSIIEDIKKFNTYGCKDDDITIVVLKRNYRN